MALEKKDIVHETVTLFLERMGFSATVTVIQDGDDIFCKVFVENGQNFLIGQHGVNLAAIQHLVRTMVRKAAGEPVSVAIDINDYFADKQGLLEKEAEQAALEAKKSGISVALRPMLPYERKIVHSYLAKQEGVTTESIGQGEGRKILVRPNTETTEA
ncbi:MAG: R3H domain-containing nucleic acid-binding protein [Patescibacteria group bacterium]